MGKLYFIQGQGKVRDFLNPFSKSVKSQGIKVATNYFIRCFCKDKAILFQNCLSHPYTEKSGSFFVPVGGNPILKKLNGKYIGFTSL